jgi:hypothetical protein
MASPEQYKFVFSEEPEREFIPQAQEGHEPSHIEADDECQYCGAPYESDRSCRYCKSNPTKRAYLGKLK